MKRHEQHDGDAAVLACISESAIAQQVIRRAARLAAEHHTTLYALHVERPGASTRRLPTTSAQLERNLHLARDLGAQVEIIHSHRVADAIVHFARARGVGLILIGAARTSGWRRFVSADIVERVQHHAGDIAVEVVPPGA